MSICRVILGCWKKVLVFTSMFFWQNSISLFPALFSIQGQTCLLCQICLGSLLLHSNPLWWKGHLFLFFFFFFFLIVLDGVVDLHRTADHFIFFGISGWGIDLDYCDVDWFALDMNWGHIVVFLRLNVNLHFRLFCWLWGLLHFF